MAAVEDRNGSPSRTGSVLLRKIAAQRARQAEAVPQADHPAHSPGPRTPDRAIAGAVARAAERVHGLPMFFDRVTTGQATTAEFGELSPEHSLIAVVQGQGDALGAVAICPGLLTSIIEIQALGRISGRPAASRRPTRTDAAICVEFLNACLDEMGGDLTAQAGITGMGGYRYASFLDDPRPLALMLEDAPYRLVTVALRAGSAGQRDGQILFLLPSAPVHSPAAIPAPEQRTAAESPAARPAGVIADGVLSAPIPLTGVLCRRQITLGELQSLAPGDTISLPPGALDAATLETAAGQALFRGRLGELAGRHALRIAGPDGAGATGGTGGAHGWGGAAAPGGLAADGPSLAAGDDGIEPPLADLHDLDPFRDTAQADEDVAPEPAFDLGELNTDAAPVLNWDAEDLPEAAAMPMNLQIG